jgi:hypothetical protein
LGISGFSLPVVCDWSLDVTIGLNKPPFGKGWMQIGSLFLTLARQVKGSRDRPGLAEPAAPVAFSAGR